MSMERTILEGLIERQREIETLIQSKSEEVAELKKQLHKVKKAHAALHDSPSTPKNAGSLEHAASANQKTHDELRADRHAEGR